MWYRGKVWIACIDIFIDTCICAIRSITIAILHLCIWWWWWWCMWWWWASRLGLINIPPSCLMMFSCLPYHHIIMMMIECEWYSNTQGSKEKREAHPLHHFGHVPYLLTFGFCFTHNMYTSFAFSFFSLYAAASFCCVMKGGGSNEKTEWDEKVQSSFWSDRR